MLSWNVFTAPSVCGPKIPSAGIRSCAWTAATASPVSPYDSSQVFSPLTAAFWATSVFVAPGRADDAEAAPVSGLSTGEARMAAPAARVAPFWRGALRRASRWRIPAPVRTVQRPLPQHGGAEIALGSRIRIQLGWT